MGTKRPLVNFCVDSKDDIAALESKVVKLGFLSRSDLMRAVTRLIISGKLVIKKAPHSECDITIKETR